MKKSPCTKHSSAAQFLAKYPHANLDDYSKMMDSEAKEIMDCWASTGARRSYRNIKLAEEKAHDRLAAWADSCMEYNLTDLAHFLAEHRRACTWSILIGRGNN